MPRILRSQGITKLFKPATLEPFSIQLREQTIRTSLAVGTARGDVGRYPTKGWAPWATEQSTGTLDNFNRPDENPLSKGGFWAGPDNVGDAQLRVLGNQLAANATTISSAYTTVSYGPNVEAYVTFASTPAVGQIVRLRVRESGAGGVSSFYDVRAGTAGALSLTRVDAGVTTTLLTTTVSNWLAGHKVGIKVVGNVIQAWIDQGAGWTVALQTTDNTYTAAGPISIRLDANTVALIDDFVGGTLQQFGPRYWQHGLKPPMVVAPPAQPVARPIQTANVAVSASRRHQSRKTIHVLRPPAVVTPAATGFVAEPLSVRTVQTRPKRTIYTLRRPTALQVFAGPRSELTKARPRPTTHVLRPAAVVLVPQVEQQLRTLRVALVRGRPGKTRYLLRPAAVVLVPSVELREETIRVALVRGRPGRTRWLLRPPQTLQVFPGPRTALVRSRPRKTRYVLEPAQTLQTFQGPSRSLTATRPRRTARFLSPPTVVQPRAEFVAPPLRVWNVHIRPPRTRADLFPPAVVAPRPLAPPLLSRLVKTRPRHTVYRLQPPTTLAVFFGPRSTLTKTRPQPTTAVLVPAQVVRNPHVEQQLRTLRKTLVQTRPRATTRLLRPPTVVTVPRVAEDTIHATLVRGRRPIAKSRLFRPATLEPFSIQLREQTLRVRLVQIRPRHTTLKLRPPAKLATVTFSAGKPWLVRARPQPTVTTLQPPAVLRVFSTGETRLVVTRPRHTTTLLRPPTRVLVPSVEQQRRTLRVALVQTRPRATTTLLRPPTVVTRPPEVTEVRVALTRTRPRHTLTALHRPSGREFIPEAIRSVLTRTRPRHTIAGLNPPTVVTPFVAPVSAYVRFWLTRIRPPRTLAQLFPPRRLKNVPGTACLTDQAANVACLTDQLADEACLTDEGVEAVACLTDQAASVACLVDLSAASATLRDEE